MHRHLAYLPHSLSLCLGMTYVCMHIPTTNSNPWYPPYVTYARIALTVIHLTGRAHVQSHKDNKPNGTTTQT